MICQSYWENKKGRVFFTSQCSFLTPCADTQFQGNPVSRGVKYTGVGKFVMFDWNYCLSRKLCKIGHVYHGTLIGGKRKRGKDERGGEVFLLWNSSLATSQFKLKLFLSLPQHWIASHIRQHTELDQLLLKCISITKYKLHFFKVIQILFSITLAMTGKIQNTFLESN